MPRRSRSSSSRKNSKSPVPSSNASSSSKSRGRSRSPAPPTTTSTKSKNGYSNKSLCKFPPDSENKTTLTDKEKKFMLLNVLRLPTTDRQKCIALLSEKSPNSVKSANEIVNTKYETIIDSKHSRGTIKSNLPLEDFAIIFAQEFDASTELWLWKLQFRVHTPSGTSHIKFEEGCLEEETLSDDTAIHTYSHVLILASNEEVAYFDAAVKIPTLDVCSREGCFRMVVTSRTTQGIRDCEKCGIRYGDNVREYLAVLYKSDMEKDDIIQLLGYLMMVESNAIDDLGVYTQHNQLNKFKSEQGKVIQFHKLSDSEVGYIWNKLVSGIKIIGGCNLGKDTDEFGEQNIFLPRNDDGSISALADAQKLVQQLSVIVLVKNITSFVYIECTGNEWTIVHDDNGRKFFRHCSSMRCMNKLPRAEQTNAVRCIDCESKTAGIEALAVELKNRIAELDKNQRIIARELTSDKFYESLADAAIKFLVGLPNDDEWKVSFLNDLVKDEIYGNMSMKDIFVHALKSGRVDKRMFWQMFGNHQNRLGGEGDSELGEYQLMEESALGDESDALPSDAYETDDESDASKTDDEETEQGGIPTRQSSRAHKTISYKEDEEHEDEEK